MRLIAFLMVSLVFQLEAATTLLVSVFDPKSGRTVNGLNAGDFQTAVQIESIAKLSGVPRKIILLIDTSLVGAAVQPAVLPLINELSGSDKMALVGYHAAAEMLQEFTANKALLQKAAAAVKFANSPRLLDALYAAIEDGFTSADHFGVVILLSSGIEGPSRTAEGDVLQLARTKGVSIFPVSLGSAPHSLLDLLAAETGGVSFKIREMRKSASERVKAIFEAIRSPYVLQLADG